MTPAPTRSRTAGASQFCARVNCVAILGRSSSRTGAQHSITRVGSSRSGMAYADWLGVPSPCASWAWPAFARASVRLLDQPAAQCLGNRGRAVGGAELLEDVLEVRL